MGAYSDLISQVINTIESITPSTTPGTAWTPATSLRDLEDDSISTRGDRLFLIASSPTGDALMTDGVVDEIEFEKSFEIMWRVEIGSDVSMYYAQVEDDIDDLVIALIQPGTWAQTDSVAVSGIIPEDGREILTDPQMQMSVVKKSFVVRYTRRRA